VRGELLASSAEETPPGKARRRLERSKKDKGEPDHAASLL